MRTSETKYSCPCVLEFTFKQPRKKYFLGYFILPKQYGEKKQGHNIAPFHKSELREILNIQLMLC